MANAVIFEKREITNFESVPDFGGLHAVEFLFEDGLPNSIPPFSLEADAKYVVEWDNTEYTVIAIDGSAIEEGAVGLGNGSLFGLPSTEPFAIIQFPLGMLIICMDSTCTSTTHSVAIYQEESGTGEDTSTGIIVKDRDGNDVIHKGAYGIRARTTDGGTKVFVDADTLAKPVETSVELDFSSGDMEVLPGDGEVFSEVNIPKPVNLIPENIAEGVDIAGIIGLLSATSVGSATFTTGTFTGSDTVRQTIEHGLGVVPDIVIIIGLTNRFAGADGNRLEGFHISQALATKLNLTNWYGRYWAIKSKTNGTYQYFYNNNSLENTASVNGIYGATESTFNIGTKVGTYCTLTWIAMTGLT